MIDWTTVITTVGSVLITGSLGWAAIRAQKSQAERGWSEQRAVAREERLQDRRAAVYVEALSELGRWQTMREREMGRDRLPPLAVRDHEESLMFAARLSAYGSDAVNGIWSEWVGVGNAYEAARRDPAGQELARSRLGELADLSRRFRQQVVAELQS